MSICGYESLKVRILKLPKSKSFLLQKSLIHQMIEDQMILWRLDLKQEKMTKGVYEKMKGSWVELVK